MMMLFIFIGMLFGGSSEEATMTAKILALVLGVTDLICSSIVIRQLIKGGL